MDKTIFGWIDCPTCGHEKGMRVTADKSGAPFGFCEANCEGQLRIGGKPRRVAAFFAKHPDIAAAMNDKELVTVTGAMPEMLDGAEPQVVSPLPKQPAAPAADKPARKPFSLGDL